MVSESSKSITQKKKAAFLVAFAQLGNATEAAKAVGIERTTPYLWRRKDEAFREEWDEMKVAAAQVLLDEAHRRAVHGVEEPVYYQGEQVGAVRKYSDTLLIFLLKAWSPEHREKHRHEITGKDGGPIDHHHEFDVSEMSDDELRKIAAGKGED